MSRLSTRVPSYRQHKATGQAVVTINGCDYYLGKWKSADSRREYDRLIAEWSANGRVLAADGPDETFTLSELLAAYWRHAKAYYDRRSWHGVLLAMKHARELYGKSPAATFGPLALKAVRGKMIEAGWCRKYINRQIGQLRRVFRWPTSPPRRAHRGSPESGPPSIRRR